MSSPSILPGLAALLAAALSGACASTTEAPLELDGAAINDGFGDVSRSLFTGRGKLAPFMVRGPVAYDVQDDRALTLPTGETVAFDNVVPRSSTPTPLVVIVHGNHSRKEAHRHQAERLASFGLHAVALGVPNQGRWLANGVLIGNFVKAVTQSPAALGGRIDGSRIILAGHSFGGSAVTLAQSFGAGARGLVLLDPAVFGPEVERAMPKVTVPTLLLGADPTVFRARLKRQFFKKLGGPVVEVTVAGATHDDAQNPSMYALSTFGLDPYTSPDRQALFTAALAAGCLSLAGHGRLDFAVESYAEAVADGDLKALRARSARAEVRP